MLASPPTVPWARGAERTVEEGFPQVTADLEASVKTNVLSSAVDAGCFWRLLCTLPPLLPFPHFTPPTYAARINILWATEAISNWSGGEDWNSWQENTHSLCSRVALSFYCCISVDWARWGLCSSLAGYHHRALFTSAYRMEL